MSPRARTKTPAIAALDRAIAELETARHHLEAGTVNSELSAIGMIRQGIKEADDALTEVARATRARPKEERPTWDAIADELRMADRRQAHRWARLRGLETS